MSDQTALDIAREALKAVKDWDVDGYIQRGGFALPDDLRAKVSAALDATPQPAPSLTASTAHLKEWTALPLGPEKILRMAKGALTGPAADGFSRRCAVAAIDGFLSSAGQEAPQLTDEQIARHFHEAYERLAPAFGYETREASRKAWADVPENNKALMIAVVAEVRALLQTKED